MKIDSSHNYRGWLTHYARTLRWYARLQQVRAECERVGISQDFEDYVYAFFQNCFYLREWLAKSGAIAESQLEQLFASSVELQLCRDICNGTKHMTISRPSVDADFYTFREYDHLHIPSPSDGPHAMEKFMIRSSGEKRDTFELADRCMQICMIFSKRMGCSRPLKPNQAVERTVTRRAFTFQMIKTVSAEATLAVGGVRSAYFR